MYIPAKVNVALNMECQQSSTFSNVLKYGPQCAVDGNTNMVLDPKGACAHTTTNQEPYWWAVNLRSTYTIDYITIYNREDCCREYIFIYLQWKWFKSNLLGTSFCVQNRQVSGL